MISLNSRLVLVVKYKGEKPIAGVDSQKTYPVVAATSTKLYDEATKSWKQHDQIVIISDNGTWINLYPGKCTFMEPKAF